MHADHAAKADLQACRELMRGGSKSFFAASLLLPARVRPSATALYAFCRLADDAVDLSSDPTQALHALQTLQNRLDDIYRGHPQAFDADRALADTVRRHNIPRALLDALLEGFLWDAQGRHYDTLEHLQDYAARVAGTVGAMMALVMGARAPQDLARACDLGVAMQLTNIARDVGEDARNGRLYLPREWLIQAGIDPVAWLAQPQFNAAIASVTQRLLQEADKLYQRAEHGVAALPLDCRPAIRAARWVYAEIGRQLQRNGLDSVSRRTVVSTPRKLALMARAALPSRPLAFTAMRAALPALQAVRFLIDAVPAQASSPRTLAERALWTIDLFERHASQQRAWR